MTTRRTVLHLAGGVAAGLAGGGAFLAGSGCDVRRPAAGTTTQPMPQQENSDTLVVETAGGGVALLDASTGGMLVRPAPALISGDGRRLVHIEPEGSRTRLTSFRLPDGGKVSQAVLVEQLGGRATSVDGSLVALATPAGAGSTPYRPGARRSTTIMIADSSGQRTRLELPGNLEPEAFDDSGQVLFVLDYLPPMAPDRYRVRAVDLSTGQPEPLLTRLKTAVPEGAEEEMRGEGRQAVYDPRSHQLFTLYTHQPEHQHTRDLVAGARPDAPDVHAFVHTLNLGQHWAFCVDLPAPFGQQASAGHAIALSPARDVVCVVDATSGAAALIDPASLLVSATFRFPPPTAPVTPAVAVFDRDGTLLVGAGSEVINLSTANGRVLARWSTESAVRGLVPAADGLYVGQAGGILHVDATTGRLRRRIDMPALVALRHVGSSL
ncbi:MAG TPA: hypothetical protein VFX61_20890 [Micromonosporaceae bacterium]|nr:hypothetical protein [Micromonosporaceae bacterium]